MSESEAQKCLSDVQFFVWLLAEEHKALDVFTVFSEGQELNGVVSTDGLQPGLSIGVNRNTGEFYRQTSTGSPEERQGRVVVNLQQRTEFKGRLNAGYSALLPQSLFDKVVRDLLGACELCDLEGHTHAVRGGTEGRLQTTILPDAS